MPRSTGYVCIDTKRENNVIGLFIYVTFWACPNLHFIFSGPEKRTCPGSPPSSWLDWAIFFSMWPAKNQSRRLPMPGYVISDNPCQTRSPTTSGREHRVRPSPPQIQFIPVTTCECPGMPRRKPKPTSRKTIEDVTVIVTSQTGGRHCDQGS